MPRKFLLLICVLFVDVTLSRISPLSASQSFNFIGLKYFFRSLLLEPQLFLPNESLTDVTQINLNHLKKLGIQGLIFDKDNTLTEPYRDTVQPHIYQFLKEANKVRVHSFLLSLEYFIFVNRHFKAI